MSNKPQISIILPTFNDEKYLEASIISIIEQEFENFELIIINDGSTDNSEKIINKFLNDKRIVYIKNEINQGIVKSLNLGLELAKGDYIARFDGDDIALKNRLLVQKKFLDEHDDIFLVGSSVIVIDENGKHLGLMRKKNNYKKLAKILPFTNSLVHPSIIFRNNKKYKYREKAIYSEDYDLYLRILSDGYNITNIEEPLIKYRVHTESICSNKGKTQEIVNKNIRKWYRERLNKIEESYNKFNLDVDLNEYVDKTSYYKRMIKFYLKIGNKQLANSMYKKFVQLTNKQNYLYLAFLKIPFIYKIYRFIFYSY